ncbi:MAG: cob(I)yrinic acid a,c-diamide adenosyltransferase [Calditrichia bacterium]
MSVKNTPREKRHGLIMIYTGNGKGKTTAALGMALRATGYNWNTLIIQFIKGDWNYGEMFSIDKLSPNVELYRMGKGFVRIQNDTKPIEEHKEAALEAVRFAKNSMESGKYDLIILDEINVALHEQLISFEDVASLINHKPKYLHLLLTGRYADKKLYELADLVTEMTEIKHPFNAGIYAQPGIDY